MDEFSAATQPALTGHGAAAGATSGATGVTTASPGNTTYTPLDLVGCFRSAWTLLTRDFAALAGWALGAEALITLTVLASQVGFVLGPLVDPLLTAAVYVLFLGRMRGLRPSIGDVARSVGVSALPIVIGNILQFAALVIAARLLGSSMTSAEGTVSIVHPVGAAVGLLLIPVGVYLAIGYAFVIPLIVDQRLPLWQALERSRRTVSPNWSRVFALQILRALLLLIAIPTLGLALVVTLPLGFAALLVAYSDMFSE